VLDRFEKAIPLHLEVVSTGSIHPCLASQLKYNYGYFFLEKTGIEHSPGRMQSSAPSLPPSPNDSIVGLGD
jgi:hypothetical protein